MPEPRLSDFIDPATNTVPLHHYASANGDPHELELDISRFGESSWSKAEKKAEPTPKVFFYLDPKDKEHFLGGRSHYGTRYPADKIYDMMADPKRIVSRLAARPPFNLTKALSIVRRLGYHGVFYGSSFPTVAIMRNTRVSKVPEGPEKLARVEPVPRTCGEETLGPIEHPLPGGAGVLTFSRSRISPFHGPTWTVSHNGGRNRVFSGPEFASWIRKLPSAHQTSIVGAIKSHLAPRKLARMEDSSDVHGLTEHIATNHLHPSDQAHGMLADALQDANDPRAQIVRHTYNEAKKLDEPDPFTAQSKLESRTWAKAREIAEIPRAEAFTPKYAGLDLIPPSYMGRHLVQVEHHRGPTGKHAFEVKYVVHNHKVPGTRLAAEQGYPKGTPRRSYATRYGQAMNPQEFRDWLGQLDPDQKKELVRQLSFRGPRRLKRSGYGYCPECKAPFIRHDKENRLVFCPNGHRRRYIKTPKLKLAATRAPSGGAIVNNQYHVGGQFLPRAFKRIARVVQDHEKSLRMRALKLARMEDSSDVHGLTEHIATNHLHPSDQAHGMLADALQDANDPRAQIVRHTYNEARADKRDEADPFTAQSSLFNNEWRKERELAGISPFSRSSQVTDAVLPLYQEGDRRSHVSISHSRGPTDKHAFRVRYVVHNDPVPGTTMSVTDRDQETPFRSYATQYSQAMNPQEFRDWLNLVEPEQKEEIVRQLKRGSFQLKRSDPGSPERVLSPEDQVSIKSPKKRERFEGLLHQSITDAPDSSLPTTKELTALGQLGESTKGQYAHTGRVLAKFIGADNAKLFAASNAILSPLAPWEHHSRTSMRLLRLWREAGSPTSADRVQQIVASLQPKKGSEKDSQGKSIYGSINWGAKAKRLQHMLMNPQLYIKAIENVAGPKRGKIVDFGRAHNNPNGIPIDTHQAKLTVPPQLQDGTKVSHALVRKIAASGDRRLQNALLEAQKQFIGDPAVYNAYKVALAHAADQLGWEPRELQETVWTAAVSLVAAKNLGIPPSEILKHLTHEDAFHAWNVGGLLTKPEALGDVESLTRRRQGTFTDQANLAPSATGKISVSDPAALATVAARISPSGQSGAWKPVQEALRDKRQPKLF